jgi:regulator of Ty1 transposition protein 103
LIQIELDKSRSTGKKPMLGGSLFSSSPGTLPSELQPLAPLQTAVSKAAVSSNTAVTTANTEYDKLNGPSAQIPTPPVHAARLSQLLKSLANAESSVSDIIKSREALIGGLEKLLETNRSALAKDQSQAAELSSRKAATESKKRQVEDGIMRGLSAEESSSSFRDGDSADRTTHGSEEEELERPAIEELTPPPVEKLTPVGSPQLNPIDTPQNHPSLQNSNDLQPLSTDAFSQPPHTSDTSPPVPATEILSGLTMHHSRPQSGSPANGSSAKKRKVSHGQPDYAEFAGGDAMADLDAEVAELLRQESNKR